MVTACAQILTEDRRDIIWITCQIPGKFEDIFWITCQTPGKFEDQSSTRSKLIGGFSPGVGMDGSDCLTETLCPPPSLDMAPCDGLIVLNKSFSEDPSALVGRPV
ncbi:unnamed protein product [Cylindrotheca closterium]|uniref:Uncharacterized protein n=1 Tax=Cylindrotheca closterium TaxID=2856 RepID=A0AAD2CU74_9STRA|nr:unnamed protein product [Cylindrotheca closterium]